MKSSCCGLKNHSKESLVRMNVRAMPPVKQGQIIKGQVVGIGERGDRIIKYNNFIVFFKSQKDMGDFAKVKVDKILPRFCFATEVNG